MPRRLRQLSTRPGASQLLFPTGDGFELVMEPELSVVLFERQGWSGADYTDFAATVRAEGWLRAYPTTHNGRPVMRLCFIHPECDPAAVEEFLDRMAVH